MLHRDSKLPLPDWNTWGALLHKLSGSLASFSSSWRHSVLDHLAPKVSADVLNPHMYPMQLLVSVSLEQPAWEGTTCCCIFAGLVDYTHAELAFPLNSCHIFASFSGQAQHWSQKQRAQGLLNHTSLSLYHKSHFFYTMPTFGLIFFFKLFGCYNKNT